MHSDRKLKLFQLNGIQPSFTLLLCFSYSEMSKCLCNCYSHGTYLVFHTTCLQAPSDTQPQYGSLEAIQDLDVTHAHAHTPSAPHIGCRSTVSPFRGNDFMCKHQTYFLHLPCLSQRDSGTLTTQEVKATHKA